MLQRYSLGGLFHRVLSVINYPLGFFFGSDVVGFSLFLVGFSFDSSKTKYVI